MTNPSAKRLRRNNEDISPAAAASSGQEGFGLRLTTVEGADRISALPDAIIHDIINRLPSPKEAAKLIFVSKRWNQLWLSDPILKFDEIEFRSQDEFETSFPFATRSTDVALKLFAAAVLRKLSRNVDATSAVRITVDSWRWDTKFCSGFLDSVVVGLAPRNYLSLREIDLTFVHDSRMEDLDPSDYDAYDIPLGLLQYHHIKVLKLAYCDFRLYEHVMSDNGNPFSGVSSCLEELCLHNVSFPDERILNSMIASASRLKTLTLYSIFGIRRLEVRDRRSLKLLKAYRLVGEDVVEITGAHSLETLTLHNWEKGELRVSSTPNVKELCIENPGHSNFIQIISDKEVSKLIQEFQSLRSIKLGYVGPFYQFNLAINDKLREVELYVSRARDRLKAGSCDGTVTPSLRCQFIDVSFQLLKQFLFAKSSRFRVSLELRLDQIDKDEVRDESPIPSIELVKIEPISYTCHCTSDALLGRVFSVCRPKFLSFSAKGDQLQKKSFLPVVVESVRKTFEERSWSDGCSAVCSCWRHHLKHVKISNK